MTAYSYVPVDEPVEKKKGGSAQTLRDYWSGHGHPGPSHGAERDAIRWGTPGDFARCVAQVTTHGKMTPEQAKGYCNLRHHDALGYWPAQHAEMERGKMTIPASVLAYYQHPELAKWRFNPGELRNHYGEWAKEGVTPGVEDSDKKAAADLRQAGHDARRSLTGSVATNRALHEAGDAVEAAHYAEARSKIQTALNDPGPFPDDFSPASREFKKRLQGHLDYLNDAAKTHPDYGVIAADEAANGIVPELRTSSSRAPVKSSWGLEEDGATNPGTGHTHTTPTDDIHPGWMGMKPESDLSWVSDKHLQEALSYQDAPRTADSAAAFEIYSEMRAAAQREVDRRAATPKQPPLPKPISAMTATGPAPDLDAGTPIGAMTDDELEAELARRHAKKTQHPELLKGWRDAWMHELRGHHGEWTADGQMAQESAQRQQWKTDDETHAKNIAGMSRYWDPPIVGNPMMWAAQHLRDGNYHAAADSMQEFRTQLANRDDPERHDSPSALRGRLKAIDKELAYIHEAAASRPDPEYTGRLEAETDMPAPTALSTMSDSDLEAELARRHTKKGGGMPALTKSQRAYLARWADPNLLKGWGDAWEHEARGHGGKWTGLVGDIEHAAKTSDLDDKAYESKFGKEAADHIRAAKDAAGKGDTDTAYDHMKKATEAVQASVRADGVGHMGRTMTDGKTIKGDEAQAGISRASEVLRRLGHGDNDDAPKGKMAYVAKTLGITISEVEKMPARTFEYAAKWSGWEHQLRDAHGRWTSGGSSGHAVEERASDFRSFTGGESHYNHIRDLSDDDLRSRSPAAAGLAESAASHFSAGEYTRARQELSDAADMAHHQAPDRVADIHAARESMNGMEDRHGFARAPNTLPPQNAWLTPSATMTATSQRDIRQIRSDNLAAEIDRHGVTTPPITTADIAGLTALTPSKGETEQEAFQAAQWAQGLGNLLSSKGTLTNRQAAYLAKWNPGQPRDHRGMWTRLGEALDLGGATEAVVNPKPDHFSGRGTAGLPAPAASHRETTPDEFMAYMHHQPGGMSRYGNAPRLQDSTDSHPGAEQDIDAPLDAPDRIHPEPRPMTEDEAHTYATAQRQRESGIWGGKTYAEHTAALSQLTPTQRQAYLDADRRGIKPGDALAAAQNAEKITPRQASYLAKWAAPDALVKYNPDEARVQEGNPGAGQFTKENQGGQDQKKKPGKGKGKKPGKGGEKAQKEHLINQANEDAKNARQLMAQVKGLRAQRKALETSSSSGKTGSAPGAASSTSSTSATASQSSSSTASTKPSSSTSSGSSNAKQIAALTSQIHSLVAQAQQLENQASSLRSQAAKL